MSDRRKGPAPAADRRRRARCAFVYVKFMFPVFCIVLASVLCFMPCYRLANDETERVAQSVFGLVSVTARTSSATLASAGERDKAEVALAKSLRIGLAVFWAVLAAEIIFAAVYLVFAVLIWSAPPESPRANVLKLRMKILIPGRWAPALSGAASVIPLSLPYYILNRFAHYYRISGFIDRNPEYYTYSMSFEHFDPLAVAAAAALISLAVLLIGREWDGMYRLDLFRHFEEPVSDSRAS